ncbi:MAG: dTDP-4-dehydrorhamnose reductase [Ferruginibacter sp.]
MKTILVTGGRGQLGSCIKEIKDDNYNIIYTDYDQLDISDLNQVNLFFESQQIDYCINCAAYTAVDHAEQEQEKAYQINELGAKNLALACKTHHTTLIHISTDFVFDGEETGSYTEIDDTHPISVYGDSKLKGEIAIKEILEKYFIIRTSWLYSEHGNNFLKTMLRLAEDRNVLNVVGDQIGTPTYAPDLADVIYKIIKTESVDYGLYHFSNEGVASWYDFAKAIFRIKGKEIKVNAINTIAYPTPAKRPKFSVLDKTKIKNTLNVEIPYWGDSLKTCMDKLL